MNSRNRATLVAGLILAGLLLALWFWLRPARLELRRGNDRFGLCFVSAADSLADEPRYDGALAAGAAWNRWPLYWSWVDKGGYSGTHPGGRHDYDALVRQDLAHGLTPLVILLGTPARYARGGDSAASPATLPPATLFEPIFTDGTDEPGPGKKINPANAWASFVFETVERYRPGGWPLRRPGVRHWEIWNEPDYDLFWQGTVEEYHRLLEVGYKSIKTADPEATVLLGGLAFYDKPDWLAAFLARAGGDRNRVYFDVFSFHHYWSIYHSERLLEGSKATLAAYGLGFIPIWVTESGVAVWDDYPATAHDFAAEAPFRATMAEQAAYVIQNVALAFYQGAERYYHFMLHDDCGDGPGSAYGLRQNFTSSVCGPAQGRPRPAYAAYQLAAGEFREVLPLWREKSYEQDRVAFYRPGDSSRLVVLWATQGLTTTATLSATGEMARLYWIEPANTLSGTIGLSRTAVLTPSQGLYTLDLPPAVARTEISPGDSAYPIGGRPYLLVEADTRSPAAAVLALPPDSPSRFQVGWQGDDKGSGIAHYDVWVSEDGGPLQIWLENTPAVEADYTGRPGHSYGFAVQAQDRAGNVGPVPAAPQALTRVTAGLDVSGVVVGPDAQPVAGAVVSVRGANFQDSRTTGADGTWLPLSLPAGEYVFETGAPGYETWPAPRRVTVAASTTLTLTLAPLENALAAGDFEGDEVWRTWAWQGQVNLPADAFDGQAAVRLGDGRGETINCPAGPPGQVWSLEQRLVVPPARPFLSFLYKISTTATTTEAAWLEVAVEREGQSRLLAGPGDLAPVPDWQLAVLDLSAWQGQTVQLLFRATRCSDGPFSVTLDRVSAGSR